jgi:hypothetical protein
METLFYCVFWTGNDDALINEEGPWEGLVPQSLITRGKLSVRVYWTASINSGPRGDFSLTVVLGQNRQVKTVNCANSSRRNYLEFGMGWRRVISTSRLALCA